MMRSSTRACLLAVVVGLPTAYSGSCLGDDRPVSGAGESLREDMRKLVWNARDKVFPALVNIRVVTVDYFGGKEQRGAATGSGTIISKDGHILTNAHVVHNGKKYKVTTADKQEIDATLVGEDVLTDLAILKIDPKNYKGGALPVAELGDSDQIAVGDTVMAMGSPYSLSRSVTLGIVSNTERILASARAGELEDMELDGQPTGAFTKWIQHDALINPGNSGGPLVNLLGQVVGVNTRGGSGMGFATPSNHAKDVASKLIEHGEVPRSFIGVALRTIEKTGHSEGVLINSVNDNPPGPAAKAGIKAGDLITKINGKPVTARFGEEIPPLQRFVADLPVGTTLTLEYQRQGTTGTASVTTEKMLKAKGDQTALRRWGLAVEELTEFEARERQLKNTDGVVVTGVKSGSPGATAEPALTYGDVIKAVGKEPIKTFEQFVESYKKIMGQDPVPEFLLIQFERNGKDQVTVIKPRLEKPTDPPREVAKAWVGVAVQPVLRDLAKQLGLPEGTTGFRVTRVYPRTLAAGTSLQVGDVITGVNSEKLAPRSLQDANQFQRKIRTLKIDEPVSLTVLRTGSPEEIKLSLERTKIEPGEARRDDNKDFELNVRELTFFDRDENQWSEDLGGVVVESAEPTGWAGQGGLSAGDLIQRINDTPVNDLNEYRAAMEKIAKEQPERVVFVVLRGIRTQFKFTEPEWKPIVSEEGSGKDSKASK